MSHSFINCLVFCIILCYFGLVASAESYLNECIATYLSLYGPNHEKTLRCQDEIARLMIRTDRSDEAIQVSSPTTSHFLLFLYSPLPPLTFSCSSTLPYHLSLSPVPLLSPTTSYFLLYPSSPLTTSHFPSYTASLYNGKEM